jgi:hypothetical protein
MSFVDRNKGIYENGLKRIAQSLGGEALSLGTGALDEMMSSIQSELESFISSLPPEEQDKALQMADQQMQNFLSEFFSGARLASRKAQGLNMVDSLLEKLRSHMSDDMILEGLLDNLFEEEAVSILSDLARFEGLSVEASRKRRRSQEESSGEMLSAADEYALDMSLLDSLMSWHSGQGSDIYALGSSLFAGNDVPKEIAEGALFELESSLEGLDPSSPEYDELATLVDALSYWITPF